MKVITKHYLSKSCLDASCQWNKQRRIRSGHDDWKWVRYAIGIKMTRVKNIRLQKKSNSQTFLHVLHTTWVLCVSSTVFKISCMRKCGSARHPTTWLGCIDFSVRTGSFTGRILGLRSVAIPMPSGNPCSTLPNCP